MYLIKGEMFLKVGSLFKASIRKRYKLLWTRNSTFNREKGLNCAQSACKPSASLLDAKAPAITSFASSAVLGPNVKMTDVLLDVLVLFKWNLPTCLLFVPSDQRIVRL